MALGTAALEALVTSELAAPYVGAALTAAGSAAAAAGGYGAASAVGGAYHAVEELVGGGGGGFSAPESNPRQRAKAGYAAALRLAVEAPETLASSAAEREALLRTLKLAAEADD